ncbi:hypothetical protein [Agromyces aerolatus]|uniref:hypothetical protein n=1 Tax=Agromyces sp. LY-1074 TaxID=3074080 RepID=UPI002861DAD1|nr:MULTISPECIES: hypothetical protein [unclassified Agromyces]MDR5700548.1 hypothetical protein [Agromyces sp. LY-1074]MDR5707069.1 hypothetical protein [Agromyces sp. LY-1358]
MNLSKSITHVAAGLLAVAVAIGPALGAAAQPSADAEQIAETWTSEAPLAEAPADACNTTWSYEAARATATAAVTRAHPGWTGLGVVQGRTKGGATADFQCLDWWKFFFSNPANLDARGYEVMLDVSTNQIIYINPWNTGRSFAPMPEPKVSPAEAINAVRARGYADTYTAICLSAEGLFCPTGEAGRLTYAVTTGANERINLDPATGRVWNQAAPDLPDSVIARAAATIDMTRLDSATVPAFTCPDRHPYLWRTGYGTGLPGTRLSSDRVKLDLPTRTTVGGGLVTGWPETSDGLTLRGPDDWASLVDIHAFCSSDPAAGYSETKPTFTSKAQAYFLHDEKSFTVTTAGFPEGTLRIVQGALLDGLTFTDHGDGTATIAVRARPHGTSSILVEARNAYGMALQRINLYA